MNIPVDRRIYSDSVVAKAVYCMSDEYVIERAMSGDESECLTITGSGKTMADENLVRERLMALLNDYKLREIVANETRDIKTILYAKAFADDESLTEEDIHD